MSDDKPYNCGVYINSIGKPILFIRKPINQLPKAIVEVKQVYGLEKAEQTSKDMLLAWEYKVQETPELNFNYLPPNCYIEPAQEVYDLIPGRVAYFLDRDGSHMSVMLEPGQPNSFILFITSNPFWNNFSRELTDDEISLIGMPIKNKKSYFAPVIRPTTLLNPIKACFPKWRVMELMEEFRKLILQG